MAINEEYKEALREFFQHERDEELGRWRWPDNPDYVVYVKCESESKPRAGVRVLHERTGRSRDIGRAVVNACEATVSRFGRAARAYFEAHPERKPWEDAITGEIWALTLESHVTAWTMNKRGKFEDPDSTIDPHSPMITDGRRIWPESD
ncbi:MULTISPECIES: hypothetical protein [unclassified Microbacterium]|uniref:hypothetical protein n=1 Tax=unclassified Microbacterium TaxID=2609290 RepID=UPI002468F794|nr:MULTISPECIES: hypothetical protein [unclassified Microbacterium]MDH5133628.1 hypothetical protein [Microbacterium sp. RD10]MDH5137877.1 hypothetical protein [Microbacterium sp. RD11]MDH5145529.1 hypothetical protein [Microbacterium sp. RD12]MDH5156139.1 hypothetical protein [Microbacterium sp. RD06]MDH5166373.1 hypothetical protein [Microbacterium sp. RD02]